MLIKTLTYPAWDSGQLTTALDPSKQVVFCARNGVAGILSRGCCPGIRYDLISNSSGSHSVNVAVPEYGTVTVRWDKAASDTTLARMALLPRDLLYLPLNAVLDTTNTNDIVRELVALIDTGSTDHDLDRAHAWLENFAEIQGRSRGPGTVLTTLKSRKEKLAGELRQVEQAQAAVVPVTANLNASRERMYQARIRRNQRRFRLEAAVRARAGQLQRRIEILTNRLDSFKGKPYLESHKAAAIKRKRTQANTARLEYERTQEQLETTRNALKRLQTRPFSNVPETTATLPADLEHEVRILATSAAKIQTGLEQANKEADAINEQIRAKEEQLSAMPDFTRISPEPADWLNQLSTSLSVAVSVRHQEEEEVRKLRQQLAAQEMAVADEKARFDDIEDLDTVLETYYQKKEEGEEESGKAQKHVLRLRAEAENTRNTMPGIITLGFGSTLFLLFILGLYVSVDKRPLLYAAAVLCLAVIYFFSWFLSARSNLLHLIQLYDQAWAELNTLTREQEENEAHIKEVLALAGCATTRELEACYDRFREKCVRRDELQEQLRLIEENLTESNERVPLLFARIQETLHALDEHPESPADVERCVNSVIHKSSAYHATVRTLANLRNQLQGFVNKRRFLEEQLAEARQTLAPLERDVRNHIQETGFREESRFTDVNELLTAYQHYIDTVNETCTNREQLTVRLEELEQQLQQEEVLYVRHSDELAVLLKQYGFEDADDIESAAENAVLIADLTQERQDAVRALEALAQGHSGGFLTEDTNPCDNDDIITAERIQEMQQELDTCEEEYTRALSEYQALREERQGRLAGWRSHNEIVEDLAATTAEETECRRRLAAAARALALVDALAPQWRTHHGKPIAEKAKAILGNLGFPAHISLDLSRPTADRALTVRYEQNAVAAPGALNLALRLAALETLTQTDTPESLVVDATIQGTQLPFSSEALFTVLDRMAAHRQVLFFSEDADLTLEALNAGWPVLAI